jgi:hypothetical protein
MRLIFDPKNPYPLLDSIENTYEEAKIHSAMVDQWLGYRIEETESRMQAGPGQPWVGLSPATLQTPYTEIRYLLSKLSLVHGMKVVDLGAAYGRVGHVLEAHHPGVDFLGFEILPERANEGIRIFHEKGYLHSKLVCRNVISDGEAFPDADIYFLYDLSSDLQSTIQVMERLKEKARSRKFQVVARGRATRTTIERSHPWLSDVHTPRHFGNFSIFQS